jgi:hypothetical protein
MDSKQKVGNIIIIHKKKNNKYVRTQIITNQNDNNL